MSTLFQIVASSLIAIALLQPGAATTPPVSGLETGDDVVPWNPIHVAGPERGTSACPVCTYLERPAVLIFAKHDRNSAELAGRLEKLVVRLEKRDLKGFFVALDSTPERLAQLAADQKLSKIGVCYPQPRSREQDLKAYKINPAAKNTVLIYRDYVVVAKFVDLDAKDFERVEAEVGKLWK